MRDVHSSNSVSRLKRFREELGLKVRRSLFAWSFQPTKRELKDLPVFFFADIVRFPTGVLIHKYPLRYFKFLIRLRKYRNNLGKASWSSLSIIYHRPLVLWYYYLLFWWAEYCGVLSELLERPGRSLIAELFTRYIVEIDSIIDARGGSEYLLDDVSFIKRSCLDILAELLVHIGKLPKTERQNLVGLICKFRRNSLMISRRAQRQQELSFDGMLAYKDETAGELSRVWGDLLCSVYPASQRAENTRGILGAIAMAIQVIDDILDSPVDYRDDVSNIFIHLLKDSESEFKIAVLHFEQYPYQHLDWVWSNQHLPETSKKAVELLNDYLGDIAAQSEVPWLTEEICEIMADWKIIQPERQASLAHKIRRATRAGGTA